MVQEPNKPATPWKSEDEIQRENAEAAKKAAKATEKADKKAAKKS
jgi:hypothetical protein